MAAAVDWHSFGSIAPPPGRVDLSFRLTTAASLPRPAKRRRPPLSPPRTFAMVTPVEPSTATPAPVRRPATPLVDPTHPNSAQSPFHNRRVNIAPPSANENFVYRQEVPAPNTYIETAIRAEALYFATVRCHRNADSPGSPWPLLRRPRRRNRPPLLHLSQRRSLSPLLCLLRSRRRPLHPQPRRLCASHGHGIDTGDTAFEQTSPPTPRIIRQTEREDRTDNQCRCFNFSK